MKKKGTFLTILLILIMVAGVCLLLYPTVANFVHARGHVEMINSYVEHVVSMSPEECDEYWQQAIAYNERLAGIAATDEPDEAPADYEDVLNANDDGMLGYVDIPSIDVYLPMYHGTSDAVLQVGAGHLEWSSMPTDTLGTHCVLSGHRGLPNSQLFTKLDELKEGDTFCLHVLNKVITYEVDRILVVLPHDARAEMRIAKNENFCTLVTCTPYGVNTHRLLVRGHYVSTEEEIHEDKSGTILPVPEVEHPTRKTIITGLIVPVAILLCVLALVIFLVVKLTRMRTAKKRKTHGENIELFNKKTKKKDK